ncbi:MAG: hypothetical protein HY980_03935 [Candidatus Magasanikbacteria bacterium]|nr:hypothetical protein [Candidatus Magasanikbacteria bacterium]
MLELFLKYAAMDSKSGVDKETHPTSSGQTEVIRAIKDDLLENGVSEDQFRAFKDGSLLVSFAGAKKGKKVCYAAHVDTSPDAPGGATCIIHDNYQGGDIVLPENGIKIPAADLVGKEGKTIVTASGRTTLGADDKSGVAILNQIARDMANGLIRDYAPVDMWFCVDEEVGQLDISVVQPHIVNSWDAFITLDGGHPQEVDTDCFCGWETFVDFFGESAHPGVDGKKLKPAHYAMARLITELDDHLKTPWESAGMDPFMYVAKATEMTPVHSRAEFYPRSFDPAELPWFHETIVQKAKQIAGKYKVRCKISGKGLMYVGTGTAIKQHPEVLDSIMRVINEVVGEPHGNAVRGGTDGAMANVSYPSLPAPNLGVGMYNFHGVKEFLVVEEMLAMYEVMKRLVPAYADSE